MKILDKLFRRLGYVKNRPVIQRFYNAAQSSRLTSNWTSQNPSADKELYKDLKTLRARSRELSRNNPYVKKFLSLCKTNIIGPKGVVLQNRAFRGEKLDNKVNDQVEEAFQQWGRMGTCDVTGTLSWFKLQNLALECVARDGEVLIRKVKGFNNGFNYALQIIEADHLDEQLNTQLPNGNHIRMGVELDKWRRPVAYHLKKRHPGDNTLPTSRMDPDTYEVLPASEIIHLFDPLRPGQTRGLPWLFASMIRLNMLSGYEEAELVAARVGACKGGFFTSEADAGEYEGERDDDGAIVEDLEPGSFSLLPYGVKFTEYNPDHPSGNFDSFTTATLRGIASGMGASYHSLSNDLTDVNYSSIRHGALDERDNWKVLQNWIIETLHHKVFEDFLPLAMLSGKINVPFSRLDSINKPIFVPRRWPWVDPLKDMQANQLAIQMGTLSITDVIRETGRDPNDVMTQLAADKAQLESFGLQEVWSLIMETTPNGTIEQDSE